MLRISKWVGVYVFTVFGDVSIAIRWTVGTHMGSPTQDPYTTPRSRSHEGTCLASDRKELLRVWLLPAGQIVFYFLAIVCRHVQVLVYGHFAPETLLGAVGAWLFLLSVVFAGAAYSAIIARAVYRRRIPILVWIWFALSTVFYLWVITQFLTFLGPVPKTR